MCTGCGTVVVSQNDIDFCPSCESIVYASAKSVGAGDPGLLSAISSIKASIEAGKLDEAEKAYAALFDKSKNAAFLYNPGILYIRHSNLELASIDYYREGFMEENAQHRANATSLMYNAKLLLYKAISAISKDISSGAVDALNGRYLAFLCHVKLGDYKSATHTIKEIAELPQGKSRDIVLGYSNIVLLSAMGNYKDLVPAAEQFISKNGFFVNALYYMSYGLFKTKKAKEAKELLSIIKDDGINNIDSLLKQIG
jgi:tetratricopeptide (TPR) repeat protein